MKEYRIEININASKEAVWNALTNFNSYPNWNSVLTMKNNDSLTLGEKFDVTIKKPRGKLSKFKASTISKKKHQLFVATQKVIGRWFFQATHYFIIKEVDKEDITFIQKWEIEGLVALFLSKQIFKELELFKTMNNELKGWVEKINYNVKAGWHK